MSKRERPWGIFPGKVQALVGTPAPTIPSPEQAREQLEQARQKMIDRLTELEAMPPTPERKCEIERLRHRLHIMEALDG